MKNAIIVHGWGGSPDSEAWFPWIKKELTKKEISFKIPEMPDTNNPQIKPWVNKLKEVAKDIDKDTYFIGHSIGCQTILRYLETLNSSVKIKGVVFIAPWMHLNKKTIEEEGEDSVRISKPWIETPIKWNKVKVHSDNFLCIFSDDDDFVPLSNLEIFKEKLNARTMVKHNEGHFNDTKEIKEILEFLK